MPTTAMTLNCFSKGNQAILKSMQQTPTKFWWHGRQVAEASNTWQLFVFHRLAYLESLKLIESQMDVEDPFSVRLYHITELGQEVCESDGGMVGHHKNNRHYYTRGKA